jgi:hypothetical protein
MHFSWNATQVQGVLSQMESRLDTMSESVISKLDDMGCRYPPALFLFCYDTD